ncbi:MAG: hypothetical protein CUN55_19505, partial [Phototrophicales bacterium]
SSSVVAQAAKLGQSVKTFSFRFSAGLNEFPYARAVSDHYQTDHYEMVDDKADIANLLVRMQNIYDEPFADSSNIATFLISRFARRFMKVVLTGDGGDELLGGYANWYRPLYAMLNTPSFMSSISPLLARLLFRCVGR